MAKKKSAWNRFKVFSFVKKQPVPTSKIDSSEGITVWETSGANNSNNFPQQLLQNVYNSPAGSAAIDVWQEFVEGGGFIDPEIGALKVNRNETLSSLNTLVSADLASMWGCSVVVSYGLDGKKKGFKHLPFEETRLGALDDSGITNKIFHNPYYGTDDYDSKYTKMYYAYNPDEEAVRGQIKEHNKLRSENENMAPYPGQVYWFSIEKPMARVYPQPFYYSTISWFKIDAEIQKFHSRNIDNNFLLSVLINKYGDPSQGAGEPNADGDFSETVGDKFNEEMSTFAGAENGGSALVEWFTREEEKSDITAFPNNSNHDLFLALQTMVSDQIAIGTKTPRVLIGIGEGGKLGDTQEILNAIKVMQGRTARMRSILARYYSELFNGFGKINEESDFTSRKINPIDLLPDWVIGVLNQEQKEKYISENYNIEFEKEDKVIIKEPTITED